MPWHVSRDGLIALRPTEEVTGGRVYHPNGLPAIIEFETGVATDNEVKVHGLEVCGALDRCPSFVDR
jgi:hypothetical protein